MAKKTLQDVAQKMAEAIMEWNRAKREREEWKPVPGMVPPAKYLDNARKANVLLAHALEEYEAFQQSTHPTGSALQEDAVSQLNERVAQLKNAGKFSSPAEKQEQK